MEVVQKQRQEDLAMDSRSKREKLQEKWRCHECGKGTLKPYVFDIRGTLRYYRSCTLCDYRTKMKDYTEGVDLTLLDEKKEK
jgi:transcription elongation factor Elf1